MSLESRRTGQAPGPFILMHPTTERTQTGQFRRQGGTISRKTGSPILAYRYATEEILSQHFLRTDVGALFFLPASRRLHFQTCKSIQVFCIYVGDCPEFKSITFPMRNIIAILCKTFCGGIATRIRRPDKQINNM
jgi:hypothetical protein